MKPTGAPNCGNMPKRDFHPDGAFSTASSAAPPHSPPSPKPCPKRNMHSRSEEHTSELQSLMRISYAVFCLKKKKNVTNKIIQLPDTIYSDEKRYTQQST